MAGRRGRPRVTDRRDHADDDDRAPAIEILDAAADLFTTQGYAATSTRQIAERVGLRQGSLYHYFPSKSAVLHELLLGTVAPTLAFARSLAHVSAASAIRLHALVRLDAQMLHDARWNLGVLYLLPERRDPEFVEFAEQRQALRGVYAGLTARAIAREGSVGPVHPMVCDLPFRLVETVINTRHDDGDAAAFDAGALADAALRCVGLAADSSVRTGSTVLLREASPR